MYAKQSFGCFRKNSELNFFQKKTPKSVLLITCNGIAKDERASDALIVKNDKPNDDLPLLVGIERLDQL